jgi:hypothetical protein
MTLAMRDIWGGVNLRLAESGLHTYARPIAAYEDTLVIEAIT